jgi:hypothetical protein
MKGENKMKSLKTIIAASGLLLLLAGCGPTEPATHTVKWVVDGVIVETDEGVADGATPSYDGGTPVKEGGTVDPDGTELVSTFSFTGWDKELGPVTEDITYTAVFEDVLTVYGECLTVAKEVAITNLEVDPLWIGKDAWTSDDLLYLGLNFGTSATTDDLKPYVIDYVLPEASFTLLADFTLSGDVEWALFSSNEYPDVVVEADVYTDSGNTILQLLFTHMSLIDTGA